MGAGMGWMGCMGWMGWMGCMGCGCSSSSKILSLIFFS
jgi:hypothetical protein